MHVHMHSGLELIIRIISRWARAMHAHAHQQVGEGYHWDFGEKAGMVTLFSASNYGGKIRNKGAIALISFGKARAGSAKGSAKASTLTKASTVLQPPAPSWFWESVDCSVPGSGRRVQGAGYREPADSSSVLRTAATASAASHLSPSPPKPSWISIRGSAKVASTLARRRPSSSHSHHVHKLRKGGWLWFVQYEAQPMPNSSVSAHNAHALTTLIFERREDLAAAYSAADSERTGKLAISVWAAETQHVLGLRVALRRAFAHMPGVEDDSINYGAFLLRFALRCPDLTLFYPMRTFLLSLMATKDTTGAGEVTMPDFEACCQTLHMHEPDAAELCQPPSRLLAACGAVSAGWVQRGTVAVADFERCFDVTELC